MIYTNVNVLIMDHLAKGSFRNLKRHNYSFRLNLTGTLMTTFCLELDFFPLLLSVFIDRSSYCNASRDHEVYLVLFPVRDWIMCSIR